MSKKKKKRKSSLPSVSSKRTKARAQRKSQEESNLTTLVLPQGVELMQKEKGTQVIDIIPYLCSTNKEVDPGEYWWERTYWIHRGIGPDDEWAICPKKTAGKKCPVCEKDFVTVGRGLYDDPKCARKAVYARLKQRK